MAEKSSTRTRLLLAAIASASLLAACTTTEVQTFNVVKESRVESSRIAMGADFSKYDRLTAEEMGIFYPANGAPPVADQQRIRQIFRDAFLAELTNYEIVPDKGPTTLMVQASLIDFRNASGVDVTLVRREIREMTRPGSLVFLMELKDSQSGKVLGQAADSAAAPPISLVPGVETEWTAVEAAAARWAELFREFLDENMNK